MDTGKINENYEFYSGYEGEPEVILSVKNNELETVHIWDGYFYDIFGEPSLDGKGWNGFTKDFNQFERCFNDEGIAVEIDIDEYLTDLRLYKTKKFKFDETPAVFRKIEEYLEKAKKHSYIVLVVSD